MSLPDQSLVVPPTFSVKVSQLTPSWHASSPPSTSGALRLPPPTPVPVHAKGVEAGVIVPDAGLEARVVLSAGSTTTNKVAIRIVASEMRVTFRVLQRILTRLLKVGFS